MFLKRWDCKYYILLITSYALLLFVAIGCIFMQSDRIYAQLRFLNGGKNQYVYETSDTVGQNDYLNCSSVVFYIDEAVSQSMQCEPYMLLENSLYDYVSPIGTQRRLGSREIAVSSNVAKLYGLSVGSVVYSIHKLHKLWSSIRLRKFCRLIMASCKPIFPSIVVRF